jgi:hypothetical protein
LDQSWIEPRHVPRSLHGFRINPIYSGQLSEIIIANVIDAIIRRAPFAPTGHPRGRQRLQLFHPALIRVLAAEHPAAEVWVAPCQKHRRKITKNI